MTEHTETTLHLGPLLREALAHRGPAEDLDEALLRTLKAQGQEHGPALLAAVGSVLEMEMKRTGETREQVAARLAAEEQGPQVSFRHHGLTTTITKTVKIRAGGKEYHSLEELPPELREAVARALPGGESETPLPSPTPPAGPRVVVKSGCFSLLMVLVVIAAAIMRPW